MCQHGEGMAGAVVTGAPAEAASGSRVAGDVPKERSSCSQPFTGHQVQHRNWDLVSSPFAHEKCAFFPKA